MEGKCEENFLPPLQQLSMDFVLIFNFLFCFIGTKNKKERKWLETGFFWPNLNLFFRLCTSYSCFYVSLFFPCFLWENEGGWTFHSHHQEEEEESSQRDQQQQHETWEILICRTFFLFRMKKKIPSGRLIWQLCQRFFFYFSAEKLSSHLWFFKNTSVQKR